MAYEIDLTPENYDKLEAALRPFIESGRKVGRVRRRAHEELEVEPSSE
ncbi:Lsr2 dimerization domain-containing protein [Nocardia pseudovaccinii]